MSEVGYDVAMTLVSAALERSAQISCPVSVAVLDETRELVAFARLQGAPLFTADVARAKAFTARSLSVPTHETQNFTSPGSPFYMLETIGGGLICTIPGGIPLVVDGEVVGAVGVSGGSADQDLDIAIYAAERFEKGPKA